MSTTSEESRVGDVVDLLKSQHEQVKELFSRVEAGGTDAKEPFEELVRLLAVHETAEEMVVYPTVRAEVPDGGALAEARLREEDEAKRMLSKLEKMGPGAPEFPQQFAMFKRAVLAHAESEEHEVFARLRESVESNRLETMAKAVEAAEKTAPTHPHPHAPESASGNVLAGPFAAVADRVRDAVRRSK